MVRDKWYLWTLRMTDGDEEELDRGNFTDFKILKRLLFLEETESVEIPWLIKSIVGELGEPMI